MKVNLCNARQSLTEGITLASNGTATSENEEGKADGVGALTNNLRTLYERKTNPGNHSNGRRHP